MGDATIVAHTGSNPSPQNEQQFQTQVEDLLCSSFIHISWEERRILNEDFIKPLCTLLTSIRTSHNAPLPS
jgi:hypothetical protein